MDAIILMSEVQPGGSCRGFLTLLAVSLHFYVLEVVLSAQGTAESIIIRLVTQADIIVLASSQ